MSSRRRDCGQAAVITVLFLLVLLGIAAAVLDVGSWYREDRKLQATMDAAALAGVQALPNHTDQASTLASEYASKNGGGLDGVEFTNSNTVIRVDGSRPAPGFFSKLFGIDSVTVHAEAAARSWGMSQAKWVVPIVVNEKHPNLNCNPNPCNSPTTLDYYHIKNNGGQNDGSGSFGFINLTGEGSVGSSTLGGWIRDGFDRYMPLGDYDAVTGNNFSSSHVEGELVPRVGDILLFPVYRKLTGTGTNAKYEIVGWVGFKLSSVDFHGSNEKLHGNFTEVTWDGIAATSNGQAGGNFGATTVALIE
jgi:hypothetical protein